MFEGCKTLAELNARRKDLVMQGHKMSTVNAHYNHARKELMAQQVTFRKIPFFSDLVESVPATVLPMPIKLKMVPQNTIIVKDGVAYI